MPSLQLSRETRREKAIWDGVAQAQTGPRDEQQLQPPLGSQ